MDVSCSPIATSSERFIGESRLVSESAVDDYVLDSGLGSEQASDELDFLADVGWAALDRLDRAPNVGNTVGDAEVSLGDINHSTTKFSAEGFVCSDICGIGHVLILTQAGPLKSKRDSARIT